MSGCPPTRPSIAIAARKVFMKIGLALPSMTPDSPTRPLRFAELRKWAERAEAAGFDSLWIQEHFFVDMGGSRRGTLDCWTVLSALAAATSRVTLGPLVLCNSFHNPGLLAKAAGTLNHLSDGRLVLGLGAGWHEAEYRALGLPFDHRVSRLEETLHVLRPLLRGERTTYRGRFVRSEDAELVPNLMSDRPTPIWLGARGERMLQLTAELADGWNTAWHGRRTDVFAHQAGRLRQASAKLGRPVPILSAGLMVVPGSANPDVIGGGPDDIATAFAEYARAGADHLIVSFNEDPTRPFAIEKSRYFEEFAERVLPLVHHSAR
jgi:probable F420-dependent oxidoreductase